MPERTAQTLETLNLKFEPANIADADTLITYENTPGVTHPETYAPLKSRDEAVKELKENTYFFIKDGDIVVGTASFRDWLEGGTYIGNLTVAPSHRRRGVGRAAVIGIMEMNKKSESFTLFTHPDNLPAQALYKELGFTNEGLAKPPFPSSIDFVKMVKRVIPAV